MMGCWLTMIVECDEPYCPEQFIGPPGRPDVDVWAAAVAAGWSPPHGDDTNQHFCPRHPGRA